MGLFDTIKYPVSTPPTEEELTALPDKLYRAWLRTCGFSLYHSPRSMASFCSGKVMFSEVKATAILRKVIEEYDDESI